MVQLTSSSKGTPFWQHKQKVIPWFCIAHLYCAKHWDIQDSGRF